MRPEPVRDAHVAHGPLRARLPLDLLHQRQRHLLVRFVLEVPHFAAAVLVAHDPDEDARRTVARARRVEGREVDRFPCQLDHVGIVAPRVRPSGGVEAARGGERDAHAPASLVTSCSRSSAAKFENMR